MHAHTNTQPSAELWRPRETDEKRLAARQKQIDYGKNTVGYARYCELVPRDKRRPEDPRTPDKYRVCSKRSWDGQIRKWRRALHKYDPPGTAPPAIDEDADADAAAAEASEHEGDAKGTTEHGDGAAPATAVALIASASAVTSGTVAATDPPAPAAERGQEQENDGDDQTPKKKQKMGVADDGSRSCFADEVSRHPLPEVIGDRSRPLDEETRTTAAIRETFERTDFTGMFGGKSWADIVEEEEREALEAAAAAKEKAAPDAVDASEPLPNSMAVRSKRPRDK